MPGPFRIGVAGLGTVGAGVVKIIRDSGDLLAERAGRPIEIAAVSARDKGLDRGVDLSAYEWVENPVDLAARKDINAAVEVIGGEDGPAKALVEAALKNGLDAVTANKALLARHGYGLAVLAEEHGACLSYEASVAAGTPVIKALRESYAANNIEVVYGILNGTCNFILTQMGETGRDFADVLKEAQDKGFAEADPGFDIDGIDTGHKLAILAALAFGTRPDFENMEIEGIRRIGAVDIGFARELGCKIKLLGVAEKQGDKIIQRVEPCLVPAGGVLGMSASARNAVTIKGDFVGTQILTGMGAGAGPTASAVVADIVDLARGIRPPVFGVPAGKLKKPQFIGRAETRGMYYLRLTVLDRPGVLADVSAILRDDDISVDDLIQHGRDPGQPVHVVITTHEARSGGVSAACEKIAALGTVVEAPCLLRVEVEL